MSLVSEGGSLGESRCCGARLHGKRRVLSRRRPGMRGVGEAERTSCSCGSLSAGVRAVAGVLGASRSGRFRRSEHCGWCSAKLGRQTLGFEAVSFARQQFGLTDVKE